ncbi:MAG: molybdenum cofactor guanylyltransferase [Acidobacteriaceae bacterium]
MTLTGGSGQAEGFVLAGGGSTRMGRDKASLEVAGRPLVQHMLAKLRSLGLPVRVAGARVDLTEFAEVTADVYPGCGPLAGIEAALRASDAPRNLCVAVDLPLLPAPWLGYLMERAELTGAAATIPYAGGRPQPLCAVYRRELLPFLSAALAAGDYKVMRVIEAAALALNGEWAIDRFDCERIWPALRGDEPLAPVGEAFLNCNTPQDLELVAFHLERTANGGWPKGTAHPSMP